MTKNNPNVLQYMLTLVQDTKIDQTCTTLLWFASWPSFMLKLVLRLDLFFKICCCLMNFKRFDVFEAKKGNEKLAVSENRIQGSWLKPPVLYSYTTKKPLTFTILYIVKQLYQCVLLYMAYHTMQLKINDIQFEKKVLGHHPVFD